MSTARPESGAGPQPGAGARPSFSARDGVPVRIYMQAILALALVPLLAHAFVSIDQFVHRGDDAFYYFQVAIGFSEHGFWTFDGVHRTNGVQPLWGMLLTGIAMLAQSLGVTDPNVLSRMFVALSALLHFAGCAVLFRVLERHVSLGTAVAAAGGLLFSMGLVWSRVWGMENSLYVLMLLISVHLLHSRFLPAPGVRGALLVGLALGLTALSRLNAGLLIPCLLLYYLAFLGQGSLAGRFRFAVLMGAAASAVVLPYLGYNFATTGHMFPVSGAAKAIYTRQLLHEQGLDSRFSLEFVKLVATQWDSLKWFLSSRLLDGLWLGGSRLVFDGEASTKLVGALGALLLGLPLIAGPRAWIARLGERGRRLRPFGYLAVFGGLNVTLSIFLYPTQMRYAMVRWWWADLEVSLAVVYAALLAASASMLAERFLRERVRAWALVAWVSVLAVHDTQASLRFYGAAERVERDWNKSWNDDAYRAALWMNEHLPADARVGSWNAGILGFYSRQPVTNLDGLINDFEFLEYLEKRELARYVLDEKIEYLSDIDLMFQLWPLSQELELIEVYNEHSEFMRVPYKIYRVQGPRR